MIIFKTIEWKNFLSYGNNTTKFNFETGIIKIDGVNGTGKSTLVEVLTWCLFGSPYRKINIKSIINSRNKKDLQVTLTFIKQDDEYRIERGLKPDYFRIFKNDEIVPVTSTKRGYQQILEEDILQFNENLFNQVVVKSLTKNAPFMTLPKAEKRNISENMFDVEIFTIMNKQLKQKNDLNEEAIKTLKRDIDNYDLLINQELANIENLRHIQNKMIEEAKKNQDNIQQEIDKLTEANKKFQKGIEIINAKKIVRNDITAKQSKLNTEINKFKQEQTEISSKLTLIKNKVKMFQEVCGSCSKIKDMVNNDDVSSLLSRKEQINNDINSLIDKNTELNAELIKVNEILQNEKYALNTIHDNTKKINQLKQQLANSEKEIIKVDETKLKEYNSKKDKSTIAYNKAMKVKRHYQVLKNLYSDDGIKSQIIKKYLPSMNKLLNTYLNKFQADIVFNLDNELNEVVLTKYKEHFSYHNFSSGQRARIDLAVVFAFIEFAICKNKKANTNLLILDEITSGMDFVGKQALHEILKHFKDKQNKCIIVMNHDADVELDSYDKIYKTSFDKGFSKLEVCDI